MECAMQLSIFTFWAREKTEYGSVNVCWNIVTQITVSCLLHLWWELSSNVPYTNTFYVRINWNTYTQCHSVCTWWPIMCEHLSTWPPPWNYALFAEKLQKPHNVVHQLIYIGFHFHMDSSYHAGTKTKRKQLISIIVRRWCWRMVTTVVIIK